MVDTGKEATKKKVVDDIGKEISESIKYQEKKQNKQTAPKPELKVQYKQK